MRFSDRNGSPESRALAPLRDMAPLPPFREEPPPPPPLQSQGSGGMEIWNLLRALLRRKLLVLAIVVLGVTISAVLTLRTTPRFAATATLEVQAQETQIMQGAGVEPASIADAEFMGTQVALLNSRALAERVAESLGLLDEPGYVNPEAKPAERLSQAAAAVLGGLVVTPVRGARIIQVQFVSASAAETARIANAVSENFIEMNLERRYSATSYARKFLEDRLAVTKTALEDTERKLVQYSADQEILDLSSVGGSAIGSSLDASALVSLSGSLTEAQNQRIIVEQKYREAVGNPSTTDMLENQAIQTLRNTRSQLLAEYQTKLSALKPDHPDMLDLRARVDAIETEIEGERKNIVKALETEFRAAAAQEQALAERVEELKGLVVGLRSRSIDYNIFQREADTLRAQYDALLQRFKEVSITSGVGTSQVSILDHAQPPLVPFEPNVPSSLLRATLISIALAIFLALLVEFVDDRIKTPEDITSKLGIRVLGVIPRVKTSESIAKQLRNPRAAVTEAFSSTRAALQFAILAGSMKSFLVTGSRPSEGKTTTALALATSFAAIGRKVLIIDADLRRPSFAFDPKTSAGLVGILSQGLPLNEQVVPGPTPNLHLLPSGAVPANPAELLAGTRLMQLIEEAGRQYDLVFVDSPPVLAFADAPILGSVCDGTILVLQSGGVLRQTAHRAIERLQTARSNLIGAVLTKFDFSKAGYGATYGYGNGYSEFGRIGNTSPGKRRVSYFNDTSAKDDGENSFK